MDLTVCNALPKSGEQDQMHLKVLSAKTAMAFLCALSSFNGLTAPAAAQQSIVPTSVIDSKTGEPVAINYRPKGAVVTIPSRQHGVKAPLSADLCWGCEPELPECDPVYDYGCQPCPTNNPAAWCYQPPCTPTISSYFERRAGDDPNGPLDVLGFAASNCGYLVVTGIGGRIDGHDNYTTLVLRGQRINANGTWGEIVTYRFGTEPNHDLEVWGEAPAGHAIVGITVGQGQQEDFRQLKIYSRQISQTLVGPRLTGNVVESIFGLPVYPFTGDASYNELLSNTSVLVGLGLRSVDEGPNRTKTMALYYGTLPTLP